MNVPILLAFALCLQAAGAAAEPGTARSSQVISLDGEAQWLLAPDPKNVGRAERWWEKPIAEAKPTRVPWIIQDVFVGYHGVAWFWREFAVPQNPRPNGRYLLRFWAVDYLADVWLNDVPVGSHEGGEDPFVLDVTAAVKPGTTNRLAVRVLNPTTQRIDGVVLAETPRRNKTAPYSPGSDFNYGGLTDSVELLFVPELRVADVFARPNPKRSLIGVQANLCNASERQVKGQLLFTVASARDGETIQALEMEKELAPGTNLVETSLAVEAPHLWDLNDPFLYRVSVRVRSDTAVSFDEQSVRCGFRDFRFEDGSFRLNGRRVFLRSSHTGADTPVGVRVPYDPDLLRRDLLNVKVMGFNMIRFIAGVPRRFQLDLCDELGLMIYEENFASWLFGDSPKMAERFDHSTAGMIRRDRNHPSVVMWGLLNETSDGSVFRRAVASLPLVRSLDDSRVVMLNSGRFDGNTRTRIVKHPALWRSDSRIVPNVTHNGTPTPVSWDDSTWAPGQFALHPGIDGEYAAVRWTCPAAGQYALAAAFSAGAAKPTTTDVHLFHNGVPLFESFINLEGQGGKVEFSKAVSIQVGDRIDAVVGIGDGSPYSDTTLLTLNLKPTQGLTSDVMADFSAQRNPNGAWTYGWLPPGARPDLSRFAAFDKAEPDSPDGQTYLAIGTLSNPGSSEWQDLLSDQHPYQNVPHTAAIIRTLRTLDGGEHSIFVSEYGIGSAIDLTRLARHYEQLGKTGCEDAQTYRRFLDLFSSDWEKWKLADTFASPEDYFKQCLSKMAAQRSLGINALRSNPKVIGYSLTGTMDQGLTAEGLFTTFRELKPGTVDALFDAFYPLRWCLFAEPAHVYRGATVKLEAVLANEDALQPGEYPFHLQVVGPGNRRLLDRTIKMTIPECRTRPEPPFALPVFAESVAMDGPSGKYRFLAALEQGGAAAGGEAEFYITDPADLPTVANEIVLWGEDAKLFQWLKEHQVRTRPFSAAAQGAREVILAGVKPPAGGANDWQDLVRHIARGSTAAFLVPEVFKKGDNPAAWLPLANKGSLAGLPRWLYLSDDWAKSHPIFDGLPCGGLMDYTYYRHLLPDAGWAGQDPPAEAVAGAIGTSLGYNSGLMVSVHSLGAGHFILNTLRIRENLGVDPAAERFLRNLLNYAARNTSQPPAELPGDFDEQLKRFAY